MSPGTGISTSVTRRIDAHEPARAAFRFGDYELDADGGQLRCHGQLVAIHAKAMGVLRALIVHRDRTVSNQELLDAVWPNTCVSLSALSSALRDLRRVLRDYDPSQPIIRTYRGRGYRFVAEVSVMLMCEQRTLDRLVVFVAQNLDRLPRSELLRLASIVGADAARTASVDSSQLGVELKRSS